MKLLILNGPNLNMLGHREPDIYGKDTMEDCLTRLDKVFDGKTDKKGEPIEILYYQSNIEGKLIDCLQEAWQQKLDGVVLNAGAYTHTSIALHDAIKSIAPIPVIEVHISNIHTREDFRRQSMIAPACVGSIAGFGMDSYRLAIEALMEIKG